MVELDGSCFLSHTLLRLYCIQRQDLNWEKLGLILYLGHVDIYLEEKVESSQGSQKLNRIGLIPR